MTLVQLRYLVAIADAGLNITLAAERVHATQPGLSKQLKQLEDELGFKLFVRKGKSLDTVTHAGRQVLERARAMLAEAAHIRSIAANLRNAAQGELRIATTHTQARFALPAAIAALNLAYPQVSVHLQPGQDADVLAQLDAGRVDMAVISTAGAPPPIGIALPAYRWHRVAARPIRRVRRAARPTAWRCRSGCHRGSSAAACPGCWRRSIRPAARRAAPGRRGRHSRRRPSTSRPGPALRPAGLARLPFPG